ncbi:MAG: DUF3822 family protein [Flavobacteriaceae bacterium]
MITKSDLLKSKHLVLQDIENKQLSIQLSLDGFSFCITNTGLNKIILFRKYDFLDRNPSTTTLLSNIKAIFNEETLLHLNYSKVLVIHVNNLSAFIPKPLFDEKNIQNYIKFNNKIFDSDYFTYDDIKNQDMVSVFAPYINVNNFLIDQYGGFEYKHFSSVLVENLLQKHTVSNANALFIHVQKKHFEVIVTNHKKLILYNTFSYKTKEDFMYYILFVIEQLQLDVETIRLQLIGLIKEGDELYNIAYKYIRNISFLKNRTSKNTILEIDDDIIRSYFTLFNASS